ncbi:MAG: hypothetical protein J7K30_01595 [Deltaproteobacteria bacterium]|nr:hypothetical protein [Deltaproteobacteria bacterium]
MAGRYHYFRLHPFSLAELTGKIMVPPIFTEIPISSHNQEDAFSALDIFGGFPEPFLKQNLRTLRRWQNEKIDRLFREDIRD